MISECRKWCTYITYFFLLERLIEDHEIIHRVTNNWAPDSNNILVMNERITKYDLFNEPQVSSISNEEKNFL